MRINELVEGIGEVMEESFTFLELAGNNFNVFLIAIGLILMTYWIIQMGKYNKQAEQQGTLK